MLTTKAWNIVYRVQQNLKSMSIVHVRKFVDIPDFTAINQFFYQNLQTY